MCKMCDGATLDDCLIDIDLAIAQYGWAIEAIEPGPGTPTWAYTIGLAGQHGHPELLVADLDPERAAMLLNQAAEFVRDGDRLYGGEFLTLDAVTVELIDVHPDHFHRWSTFNMWWNYYAAGGSPSAEPRALQLRLPDDRFCPSHRQPRLDQPGSAIGHTMPRALRRARQRHVRKRTY